MRWKGEEVTIHVSDQDPLELALAHYELGFHLSVRSLREVDAMRVAFRAGWKECEKHIAALAAARKEVE